MTLHDLTDHLSPQFPASVQKDLRTAVRVLAQSLRYPDAKSCPVEACSQPLSQLYHTVQTFLASQGKGPHTIRNTKNNLSRLFRLAFSEGLLSPTPEQLVRRFGRRNMPNRLMGDATRIDGSHLRRKHWPAEVEAEFTAFTKWATDPLVHDRDAKWKKRLSTIQVYAETFESYFGYLHHHLRIRPVTFQHLFEFPLLEQFVFWHINEKFQRTTTTAHKLIQFVHAMSRQYRVDPQLEQSLKALRKRVPPRRLVHDKNEVWIPLQEIQRVGLALWPTKSPTTMYRRRHDWKHPPGRRLAAQAGLSLMLQLWVYIPYRQRNMREMKREKNLYRTSEGHWRIKFAEEELKVDMKGNKPNVFDLPFPPALVGTLETYLTTWRPLLASDHQTEVFLNLRGTPFRGDNLRETLQRQIFSFTGHRWHPHILRTVWATEWILGGGDFMTTAIMLNDTLEVVIRKYAHLRNEGVAENAYQWVQSRVNGH